MRGWSPTRVSDAATRSASSARVRSGSVWAKGSLTVVRIVSRGLSELNGSWKTACTARR